MIWLIQLKTILLHYIRTIFKIPPSDSVPKLSFYFNPRANGAPGDGTNSARLFTPGETKALAKSKVHQ